MRRPLPTCVRRVIANLSVTNLAVATLAVSATEGAAPAAAQVVGHVPSRSPFADIEYHQELTLFGGYLRTGRDPAHAAPLPGALLGARYDIRLGGPAYFYGRVEQAFTRRTPIDPTKPAGARMLPERAWPLMLADVGIALNLTGDRSFHGLVPLVNGGLGVATDFHRRVDIGFYRFGTTFALAYGAGVKWLLGERVQARVDIGSHLYQIKYPETYYRRASDSSTTVAPTQATSFWKNNGAVTLGVSYLFSR